MNGFRHNCHILLTNDDGFEFKDGLMALFNRLSSKRSLKLTAVMPLYEQSAVSHAITILTPVFLNTIECRRNRRIYTVKGTPTDCIKLALGNILPKPPDYVISGINFGANVGTDVFYSGTVAAALESSLHGITSFAVSWERSTPKKKLNFSKPALIACKIIREIINAHPKKGAVFNINIPSRIAEIKGLRYTTQDLRVPKNSFASRVDPKGRSYYWMRATEANNKALRKLPVKKEGLLTDVVALESKYISITSLRADLADKTKNNNVRIMSTLCNV